MEILLSKSQRLKVPFLTGMKRVGGLDTTLELNMKIKRCQHLKGNFTEKKQQKSRVHGGGSVFFFNLLAARETRTMIFFHRWMQNKIDSYYENYNGIMTMVKTLPFIVSDLF